MQPTRLTYWPLLRSAISSERLDAYRRSHNDTDVDVIARYLWNTALSEALYPAIQGLEVALRNGIHNVATDAYATAFWFDLTIIHQREADKVADAKTALRNQGKPLEAGRIVAELNFGFWTSLFDSRYEQILWPRLLKSAFPAMPRRIRTRRALSSRLNRLLKLRNRIFHHEPIWYWSDLKQQHADTLETIGWISPALHRTLMLIDRFPEVHGLGSTLYNQRVTEFVTDLPGQ